jgi:hypothetical protein
LVDVEDIYVPGAPAPFEPNSGSKGYRHLKDGEGETLWRAEGDRYAGAVLAAEMIILANLELGRKATDEGYFTDHRGTSIGVARYREAQGWLKTTAPAFAKVFERSWLAESLEECPKFSELRMPIKELANSITRESTEPVTISPLAPPRSYDTGGQGGRVAWEPWDDTERSYEADPKRSYEAEPKREVSAQSKEEGKTVMWDQGEDTTTEAEDEVTITEHDRPRVPRVVWILLRVLVWLAVLFVIIGVVAVVTGIM